MAASERAGHVLYNNIEKEYCSRGGGKQKALKRGQLKS